MIRKHGKSRMRVLLFFTSSEFILLEAGPGESWAGETLIAFYDTSRDMRGGTIIRMEIGKSDPAGGESGVRCVKVTMNESGKFGKEAGHEQRNR